MAPRKQAIKEPKTTPVTEVFSIEGINEIFKEGIDAHAAQIENDLMDSFNEVINKYNMQSLTKPYVIHILMKNWNVVNSEDNSEQFKQDVMFKLLKSISVEDK